ncbi:MAG TPA: phospholipase [Nitrospinaceae bacterium]|jgi:predicted esterase|nr:phospholipase [Nitrospinaceae bacterium]|tara:strand:- start:2548 stop:3204 length:657 start_codon:yes stop_codon:yes gene_type:complete
MSLSYKTTEWNSKKVILGEGEFNLESPVNILIGFHGAESTPENMLVHGNRLQLNNTLMLFPEGPVDAGESRWSWWNDGPRQKESVGDFLNFSSNVMDMAQDYLNTRFKYIEIRFCLWGFSQGGAASLVYTLLGTHPLHKVASVCGFLPEIPDQEIAVSSPASILGIFGTNDDVVPSFLAEHALEEMKTKGHNPTLKETNQGHELNQENLMELRHFFES